MIDNICKIKSIHFKIHVDYLKKKVFFFLFIKSDIQMFYFSSHGYILGHMTVALAWSSPRRLSALLEISSTPPYPFARGPTFCSHVFFKKENTRKAGSHVVPPLPLAKNRTPRRQQNRIRPLAKDQPVKWFTSPPAGRWPDLAIGTIVKTNKKPIWKFMWQISR